MYTRCPSCRAQISFDLPQSADSFPEGYKHKIKCPSCGVTIGVKIPRVEAAPQPTYTPANPAASNFEPTYQAAPPVAETKAEHKADKKAAKNANKKSGIGRNIVVMLFSLIFVALSVVAYLVEAGTITNLPGWAEGLLQADGISYWKLLVSNFNGFKEMFAQKDTLLVGIYAIVQLVFFTLAGVNFIIALIAAIGKKYGRAWNFIAALILLACAVVIFFAPILVLDVKIADYFKAIIETKEYSLFVLPALGLLQFIFALCFCASLNRKVK